MSLQNIQAEFLELLLSGNDQSDLCRPSHHIKIYKRNSKAHLSAALLNIYPMIAKLTGDAFFRQLALEYIDCYPSRSGNLNDYGEYFSDFIAEFPELESLVYLGDVAKFEWLCHSLQFASDHVGLDLKSLQTVPPSAYDKLYFSLHPASCLMQFAFPISRIIELCTAETHNEINLDEGKENLLIIRRDQEIILVNLSPAEFHFLSSLQSGNHLSAAFESTLEIDPWFNLEKMLTTSIQNKTLVEFSHIC